MVGLSPAKYLCLDCLSCAYKRVIASIISRYADFIYESLMALLLFIPL